jgi:tellurite resistance protein TerC
MQGVETIATMPMWIGFIAFVLAMLAIDMAVLGGRRAHRVSAAEALGWSIAWFLLALLFNLLLWWHLDVAAGREVANRTGLEFLSGYLIEKTLSVDNIFVFLLLFGHFAVPAELQRRVLLYGVIGAIAMRAAMVLLGAWLISQFSWILYLFGAFLLITGVKMFAFAGHEPDLERNPLLRWMRGHLRITQEHHGERFFVMKNGLRHATPLFLVLVLIELTDLVFAVDSIPVIFAITSDPFIVFTSNMFAIMGLRSLYFLLADMAERFHYMKYGLALVLVFIGAKMLAGYWVHLPVGISLAVVAAILSASVVVSLWLTPPRQRTG